MPTLKKHRLTVADFKNILSLSDNSYDTLIETGTYRAETTLTASKIFDKVYSIELSKSLYEEAIIKCQGIDNIQLHRGNSADVLHTLNFKKPVVYFLDAHACKTKPMVTSHTFPLWKELDFICSRAYEDIVIIDDVHAFGHEDTRSNEPLWKDVTFESIEDYVLKYKTFYRTGVVDNTFVVYLHDPR